MIRAKQLKAVDLPPLQDGDSTLAERARARLLEGRGGRVRRPDTRTVVCAHCGRAWFGESKSFDGNGGRVMGFLVSAARNHASTCSVATPEERRAIARLDMRRWARSRAKGGGFAIKQAVEIDFAHAGYGSEPIFEDAALRRFGSSLAQVDTDRDSGGDAQQAPAPLGSAVHGEAGDAP